MSLCTFDSSLDIRKIVKLFHLQAVVIAVTSDFIPRLVYKTVQSTDDSWKGYVKWTLSSKLLRTLILNKIIFTMYNKISKTNFKISKANSKQKGISILICSICTYIIIFRINRLTVVHHYMHQFM